ncbi:MAG: metallophosphoesterase family protein [Hahellaceae bacterium]|nr:metallophosphoesterase family protein [Hahellaceae bacterium]
MARIGVISDTHGLVRGEVYGLFKDCDIILHAGDIGNYAVLEKLKEIAPVVSVRGNIDKDSWAEQIEEYQAIHIDGKYLIFFTIFKTWISSLKSSLTW